MAPGWFWTEFARGMSFHVSRYGHVFVINGDGRCRLCVAQHVLDPLLRSAEDVANPFGLVVETGEVTM